MKTSKITLGVVSTITLGIIIYAVASNRKHKVKRRLLDVSDAGYETAYDILYPMKPKRFLWGGISSIL